MSIYDSLLASQQQGLQTQNQNQMAMAQMPTFADKFLAGLRSGQDMSMKQNMDISSMQHQAAMNQNYRDQRNNQTVAQASKFGTASSKAGFVAQLIAGGIPADVANSMVPDEGSLARADRQKQSIADAKQATMDDLADSRIRLNEAIKRKDIAQVGEIERHMDELTAHARYLNDQASLYETDANGNPLNTNSLMGRQVTSHIGMMDRSPVVNGGRDVSMSPPPPGYHYNPDGSLAVTQGGPVDAKQAQDEIEARIKARQSIANLDELATKAKDLANHPGLGGNYGLMSGARKIPGTDAANFAAKLGSLVANQFGAGVESMKNANGQTAIGRILQSEVPFITQRIANVQDSSQTPEAARQMLAIEIPQWVDRLKARINDAAQARSYQNIPGSTTNPNTPTDQPGPQVTSSSSYQSTAQLPPTQTRGNKTYYLASDGNYYSEPEKR